MAELFDLVAGTSTGSLLTTAIVLPNNNTDIQNRTSQKNMYFADKAIEVYTQMNSQVFLIFQIPLGW